MLKQPTNQEGVSLIEAMIGLAVFALLVSLAAPSFRTFMQNSQIRNAAEAIQNGLNMARSEAVRRNTGVAFILGTGSSWTVGCATPVADLDGDGADDCPSAIQSRPAAEGSTRAVVETSEVVASTNTVATTPVFTTTLTFNGLGRERTLPAANNALFNISNPTGGTCSTDGGEMRCLRVVVTPGGQIRMCDPARPVTVPPDPQAC